MIKKHMIPSEYGRHLADRHRPASERTNELLQTSAALNACLQQLVERLARKGSLSAQDVLDTLVCVSDNIHPVPANVAAAQKIEDFCREVAKIPGVTRAPSPPRSDREQR